MLHKLPDSQTTSDNTYVCNESKKQIKFSQGFFYPTIQANAQTSPSAASSQVNGKSYSLASLSDEMKTARTAGYWFKCLLAVIPKQEVLSR